MFGILPARHPYGERFTEFRDTGWAGLSSEIADDGSLSTEYKYGNVFVTAQKLSRGHVRCFFPSMKSYLRPEDRFSGHGGTVYLCITLNVAFIKKYSF